MSQYSNISDSNANVAARLRRHANERPEAAAIRWPVGSAREGTARTYNTLTFADLEMQSTTIAAGLQKMGIGPGKKIALLVRFGADFITLVFALLKTGCTLVLIDPGMGRRNLIRCLSAVDADGFVAIPIAQFVRGWMRKNFPNAKLNVTVGRRYGFLPKPTLDDLRQTLQHHFIAPHLQPDSPAAIIFTTGSTGPPKGVLYTHATFNHQIDQLVERYGIGPGGADLSGFPLFGLFNAVMGVTTIIPDMDPTRPANADPVRLLDAIDQWQIDQAFGSPALWTAVGKHCQATGRRCCSLKRILSAGAPVPAWVLQWMRQAMADDGQMFTPYGATEALPVASIESREILEETSLMTRQGKGTCVGKRFSGIRWQVIAIDDGPIEHLDQARRLGRFQIGELIVSGPVVTQQYVTRTDQNALHKILDGERLWHRMGDVGYLDDQDRFWFCGRKSHRVQTSQGELYTEQIEAIINTHPHVYRSALVGIGQPPDQTPVIIIEPWPDHRPQTRQQKDTLIQEVQQLARSHELSSNLQRFYIYPRKLPTDIRHNAKIFREQLVPWAAATK